MIEYDHHDPQIIADPYPCYHSLRGEDPYHWSPLYSRWIVTRFDDVAWALNHPQLSSRRSADIAQSQGQPRPMNEVERFLSQWLLMSDPPLHTELRATMQQAFLPRYIQPLRARIEAVTDSLLDSLEGKNEADLMTALAFPLPSLVIGALLGVPSTDVMRLKLWTDHLAAYMATIRGGPQVLENAKQGVRSLKEYFAAQIAEHRKAPREDLMSHLITFADQGKVFDEERLVATCAMIVLAGHETTTSLIGNGLWALMKFPEQWRRLCQEPALIPSAVEEALRFESPVQWMTRFALEDLQRGPMTVQKGQRVMAVVGAANRDPDVFQNPDAVDIARPNNRHLAFGIGTHFCLGAALARLEGQIAFAAMARRFPNLHLKSAPVTWRADIGFRGLTVLPVVLR